MYEDFGPRNDWLSWTSGYSHEVKGLQDARTGNQKSHMGDSLGARNFVPGFSAVDTSGIPPMQFGKSEQRRETGSQGTM